MNLNHIIYVSCDPITLVRDLKDLMEYYKVKEIQPFNMFPRTYHCESITVLERR
jgi:23S rRNA (uracil1939-C5)-methyltransferase